MQYSVSLMSLDKDIGIATITSLVDAMLSHTNTNLTNDEIDECISDIASYNGTMILYHINIREELDDTISSLIDDVYDEWYSFIFDNFKGKDMELSCVTKSEVVVVEL